MYCGHNPQISGRRNPSRVECRVSSVTVCALLTLLLQSRGLWTLPAGFMELGESAAEGAVRETWEEACARVRAVAPFAHFDVPAIGQSYVLFRAELAEEGFAVSPASMSLPVQRSCRAP